MLEKLEQIRQQTPDEHPWLGDRAVRKLSEALAAWQDDDGKAKLWQLNALLGINKVIYGDEQAGIDNLKKAYDLVPSVRDNIRGHEADENLFQLAVAYLRLGETQNCCARNTPDSCIVPIHGAGIHTRTEGSRAAIKCLTELLSSPSLVSNREATAKWLLNLAYMTIGEYPDSVPKEYLIPPEVFGSSGDFPHFPNISQKLGLDNFNNCGGAIIDDFDGDGYLDIFITSYDPAVSPRLYINNGSGGFVDRSKEAGLEGINGGLNCVQADFDNDGAVDILILRGAWLGKAGCHPNSLLKNDGHGHFTDVTFDAGLGDVFYPTHSAAWADYDNDGFLDLYVGHESTKEVRAPSQLFHNNGDGTFTDVTEQAGVDNFRFAKGVTWGDYDGDGYPDLYVSNLGDPNRLYHNNHDGTFTDVATMELQQPLKSFACWFWDFDNDGALDLYVTSYSSRMNTIAEYYLGGHPDFDPPCLFRGDGHGGFENVTEKCGLNIPMLPMGVNFGDVNNDGYPDFYLGTGDPSYFSLMPNLLFVNHEGKSFENVTMAAGMGHLQKGHGISFADLDNDGDLDVFEQMGGAFRGDKAYNVLYENPGFGNNWLSVDVVGTRSNRSAIGARLHAEVVGPDGSVHSVYRHVNSGGSFGANPLRQTLGLGKDGKIQLLEVFWPTTHETQQFRDVPTNQIIRITEGDGKFTVRNLKKLSFD